MAIYEAGDVITISGKSRSVTVLLRGSAVLEVAGATSQITERCALGDAMFCCYVTASAAPCPSGVDHLGGLKHEVTPRLTLMWTFRCR